jgi:hypothetical protein
MLIEPRVIATGLVPDAPIGETDTPQWCSEPYARRMIRSILLFKFKPGTTDAQIEDFHRGLAAVPFEGRRHFEFHRDLRLTDDAMDAAVIADFDDEETYRAWADDPDHHSVRSQYLDPIRGQRERFLYKI